MSAWAYCGKCGQGFDKPTPREIVEDERVCPNCGHGQNPRVTKAEYLIDLGERLEELEAEVKRLNTIIATTT